MTFDEAVNCAWHVAGTTMLSKEDMRAAIKAIWPLPTAQSEPRAAEGAGMCPDCATVTDYRDGIDNSEFVPCVKHTTAAAAVTAGGDAVAWLIERRPDSCAPSWYNGEHRAGCDALIHSFTTESTKAIRYPTRSAALYALTGLRSQVAKLNNVAHLYVTEHEWIAPAPRSGVTEATVMAAKIHPATRDLVERFCVALLEKLAAAEKKYGYTDGWASHWWMDECRAKLREHIEKGDPRDVAAYCAFLWHHKEPTHDTVDCECRGAFLVNDPDGIGICLSCSNTLRRRKRPDEIVPPAAQAQDAGPK